jgi:alkylation response protein AidB-like acyl-CoA dehydrogenase
MSLLPSPDAPSSDAPSSGAPSSGAPSPDADALRQRARALAAGTFAARAAEWDRTETYCWANIPDLLAAGFMGMTIPRAYGGGGRSFHDVALVVEEMARVCTLTARIVVEANMGGISAIMEYGTEAQKRLAAGLVLAGDKPAICITEPEAGSAATDMSTRADRRGDGYVLNGRKVWITGGGVSRLHLVFARVFDERHGKQGGREEGIGGFIVVADPARGEFPRGFSVVRREATMGLRGMPEAELAFEDVEVPAEMALVPPEGFRRGFARLMEAYNSQRVGAGTIAMGVAAGALDLAVDYVKRRRQFGRPIAEFQGLQWMLADMDTQVAAARALLHQAALSRGKGGPFPDPILAARAKLFASEAAIKVVNDALQMFGARGYSRDLPLERMARDVRMFTIGGGTAQVLRTALAASVLGMKLPQTRDGYLNRDAAE